MRDGDASDRTWHELARVDAPVAKRSLWQAILEKTEFPERYNPALDRAEVIDHDAVVVVRRTHPAEGEPYIEWVRHELRTLRVEYRRHGEDWRRAQALVETESGACLIYQVDDVQAAADVSGITEPYAARVLQQLVDTARALDPLAV